MTRWMGFLYGVLAYLAFLGAFVYTMGFVSGLVVPTSLSSVADVPLWPAAAIDVGLLGLFALQHTIMARPWFKRAWTRIVPEGIERSTFVIVTCIVLALLFVAWRPIGGVLWDLRQTAFEWPLLAIAACGWLMVLAASFQIDHFELFGLKQAWRFLGRTPAPPMYFEERGLYRHVRHPLMLGFLIAFWSAPHMTYGHLLFSVVVTLYILVGTRIEERDLVKVHGSTYLDYRRRVPGLIPGFRSGSGTRGTRSKELVASGRS